MSHQPNTHPQLHETSCFDATPDSPPPFWQPVPLIVLEASVAVLHSEGDRASFEGHLLQDQWKESWHWPENQHLHYYHDIIPTSTSKLYGTLWLIFSVGWACIPRHSNHSAISLLLPWQEQVVPWLRWSTHGFCNHWPTCRGEVLGMYWPEISPHSYAGLQHAFRSHSFNHQLPTVSDSNSIPQAPSSNPSSDNLPIPRWF